MSVFYEMVLKEIDRLDKEIENYEAMMKPLKKGTTRIVDDKYVYLAEYKKEEGITKTTYIGLIQSKEAQDTMQELRLRKYYEEWIRLLKAQKDEMEAYERAGRKYNKVKEESKANKGKTKTIKAKKIGKKKKQSKVKEEDYELE